MVAAGSGSRLGAEVPKALVELDGVSLVRRSVDALAAGGVQRVVVTIPEDHRDAFERALSNTSVPVELATGGGRRQDSVRLGLARLAELPEEAVVLIHDAARPLVPRSVVRAVVEAVVDGASAVIPVVPVVDSVRQLSGETSMVVDRSALTAVQTPQGFPLAVVRDAHEEVETRGLEVTDDASVCELLGHAVTLVPGDRNAFKITEPIDLVLARALVEGADR